MTNIVDIVSRLQAQMTSLRTTLSGVEASAESSLPTASHLFDGLLIQALLAGDAGWFSQYKSHFGTIQSTMVSDPKLGCQILVVATLLCMQRDFKLSLLSTDGDWFFKALSNLSPPDDVDCILWFKNVIFSLIKSKEDRPRIVAPQLEAAGMTFADQLQLEEAAAKNPDATKIAISGPPEEWAMSGIECEKIVTKLLFHSQNKIIETMVKIKAEQSIASLCRYINLRPLVIQFHGVQVLIDADKNSSPQIQVAIARLCMTTAPHVWNYAQSLSLALACLSLIETNPYELFKFEAAIGLVNLLSFSSDVRDAVLTRTTGWLSCFDLISSSTDPRLQLVGAELVCNLCLSDLAVAKVLASPESSLAILMFLLQESDNEQLRLAVSGAVAILSERTEIQSLLDPLIFVKVLNSENISEQLALRIVAVLVAMRGQELALRKFEESTSFQSEQLLQLLHSGS